MRPWLLPVEFSVYSRWKAEQSELHIAGGVDWSLRICRKLIAGYGGIRDTAGEDREYSIPDHATRNKRGHLRFGKVARSGPREKLLTADLGDFETDDIVGKEAT